MPHTDFTLLAADGQRLFYQCWADGGSPKAVVCLVHGLGEHTGRYGHVASALNRAGYTMLGCDLRGHGRSDGLRGHAPSWASLLDDIDGLLNEAGRRYPGLPRFLYGHSLGGGLVLNFELFRRVPVAGVIASGPSLRPGYPIPGWKMILARVMSRLLPTFRLSNGLDRSALSRDPEVVRAYITDPLVHDRVSARLGLDLLEGGERTFAHAAEWPAVPLLLVAGTADRITSTAATQEFAGKVPGDCILKLWDGLYHETHNEPEKAAVLEALIGWMDQRPKAIA